MSHRNDRKCSKDPMRLLLSCQSLVMVFSFHFMVMPRISRKRDIHRAKKRTDTQAHSSHSNFVIVSAFRPEWRELRAAIICWHVYRLYVRLLQILSQFVVAAAAAARCACMHVCMHVCVYVCRYFGLSLQSVAIANRVYRFIIQSICR